MTMSIRTFKTVRVALGYEKLFLLFWGMTFMLLLVVSRSILSWLYDSYQSASKVHNSEIFTINYITGPADKSLGACYSYWLYFYFIPICCFAGVPFLSQQIFLIPRRPPLFGRLFIGICHRDQLSFRIGGTEE